MQNILWPLLVGLFSCTAPTLTPRTEPVPVGEVAMTSAALKVQSRPLIRRVSAADPIGLAIHWETTGAPAERVAVPGILQYQNTLDSFEVIVVQPDGKRSKHKTKWTDTKEAHYDLPFAHAPTVILSIQSSGLSEGKGFNGEWVGDKPSFSSTGIYNVKIEGAVHLDTGTLLAFSSAPVAVEVVASGVKSHASMERRAYEEQAKISAPSNFLGRAGYTESGFVFGATVETDVGEVLVRGAEIRHTKSSYILHTTTFTLAGDFVEHSVRQINTCLIEGTLIDTESGLRAIESLVAGDEVWSYDFALGQRMLSSVLSNEEGTAEHFVSLGGLTVTREHPIFVDGAWVAAGEIKGGGALLTSTLEAVSASPVASTRAPTRVFNLDVDGPDNFFAEGLLVHNKDRAYHPAMDDPWFFLWSSKERSRGRAP